ncbi:response regulator [Solirubrobacter ginsenosidimutans]|uniref:histidine kinase n=2 Tax=Solirubrobacter ginsenosidimutans TaxID=490573 RepID=A0A9X3S2P6_9ACTN|nr:response regulator [Solirubrobacter ginsenosidimutans]
MARLLATFAVEADEHLVALRRHLLELSAERPEEEARALVESTFRDMHTLKGAARSVGQRDVERLCASCEALLSVLKRSETLPGEAVISLLDEAVAAIAVLVASGPGTPVPPDLLERLDRAVIDPDDIAPQPKRAPEPEPEPEPAAEPDAPVAVPGPAVAAKRAATIRMATDDLDVLLRRGEELLAIKLAADEWVTGAEAFHERLRHAHRAEDPLAEIRALEATARAMVTGLRRDRRSIAGAVDGLLEQAQRVRMMPASSVLDLLPLMVRDLAQSQDKRVEFSATGGELRVDRRVLEAIKGPLIHMVRNAVDHGLEPADERTALGKPAIGRLTATVRPLERGRVEFVLTDDGRGIDAQRVQDAARRARIAVPASEEEALALVFRSGLSTSFVITDVSGHGLGLAIVKEQVTKLGGEVQLDTRPGEGTTIRLIAPATIATFRGLLVRAGEQRFLLPIENVDRAIAPEPLTQGGQLKIRYEGELLPCAPLANLLGIEASHAPSERLACAILNAGGQRAGVLVDEIVGDREVLVKDFEPPLIRVRNVAAAGLLGAGELVLVLRPADLVAGAAEARTIADTSPEIAEPAPEPDGPPWVLVVDDAVTTRAMERGLLELAGYQVKVAVDGLDAWTTLKSERFDLVVSDVDMPRMNGFELTQRIRADERLQDLPVVLVSALEAREDKERGIEVGANAYVVKSSFEQSNLLEIINRLGVRP